MSDYISDNELIIMILGGIAVGGFITGQFDISSLVATGLIGFLGGLAISNK